jgi:uncharacterized membrane protein
MRQTTPHILAFYSLSNQQLKPISKVVMFAEAFDMLTTFAGCFIFPQMWEANPLKLMLGGWIPVILLKVIATLCVIVILERVEKWPRLVWVVPSLAFLPVLLNSFSILAEVLT